MTYRTCVSMRISAVQVRQGLKEISDWPTYPQLYAAGELLGGCDIVLELAKEKALKQEIQDSLGTALPNGASAASSQTVRALSSECNTSVPALKFSLGCSDASHSRGVIKRRAAVQTAAQVCLM